MQRLIIEFLFCKVVQLTKDFQSASNEKDRLLSENANCNLENVEMLERLQANITSLTEERDQLLEVLQCMREEKNQLRSDLDMKDEMVMNCLCFSCLKCMTSPISDFSFFFLFFCFN